MQKNSSIICLEYACFIMYSIFAVTFKNIHFFTFSYFEFTEDWILLM